MPGAPADLVTAALVLITEVVRLRNRSQTVVPDAPTPQITIEEVRQELEHLPTAKCPTPECPVPFCPTVACPQIDCRCEPCVEATCEATPPPDVKGLWYIGLEAGAISQAIGYILSCLSTVLRRRPQDDGSATTRAGPRRSIAPARRGGGVLEDGSPRPVLPGGIFG